nr:topless-related protein 4 [Tanacetum cinerariifolium]
MVTFPFGRLVAGSALRIVCLSFGTFPTCSPALQASLMNEIPAFVTRVLWSPDGLFLGIAFSKHIVQIYYYLTGHELRNHLEAPRDASVEHYIQPGSIDVTQAMANEISSGNRLLSISGHRPMYSSCGSVDSQYMKKYRTTAEAVILVALHGKSNLEEETRQPPAEPPLMLISHLYSWICHRRSSSSQFQEI